MTLDALLQILGIQRALIISLPRCDGHVYQSLRQPHLDIGQLRCRKMYSQPCKRARRCDIAPAFPSRPCRKASG